MNPRLTSAQAGMLREMLENRGAADLAGGLALIEAGRRRYSRQGWLSTFGGLVRRGLVVALSPESGRITLKGIAAWRDSGWGKSDHDAHVREVAERLEHDLARTCAGSGERR